MRLLVVQTDRQADVKKGWKLPKNIENYGKLEDKFVEVRLYTSETQNAVDGPIIFYHLVGGGGGRMVCREEAKEGSVATTRV